MKPYNERLPLIDAAIDFGVSGEGARMLFKRGLRFIDNGGDK